MTNSINDTPWIANISDSEGYRDGVWSDGVGLTIFDTEYVLQNI